MTKYEKSELEKLDEDRWNEYYNADATERNMRDGNQDKPEVFFKISPSELEGIFVLGDRVLINIDELTEMTGSGALKLLPEGFGDDQNNTKHQSVSGIVVAGSIQAGTRVFFHYNCIVGAKTRLPHAGIFVECEGKGYVLLPRKVIYVGIFEGNLVALHPNFCITEPIGRFGWTETQGLLSKGKLVEKAEDAKEYEPFCCRIIALPDASAYELLRPAPNTLSGKINTYSLKVGDVVECGKAWDIPVDNGLQCYFDDRKLFRTRISNIKTKIEWQK